MRTRTLLLAAAILTLVTALSTTGAVSAAPASRPLAGADQRAPAAVPMSLGFSSGCFTTTRPVDCTISEPTVDQPRTTYFLTFRPGDHVQVIASGCVQTGGHGKTWKRYVDPASDNDLYHGLITIPGATSDQDRLVNVVGRQYTVFGSGGNLVLGYQDDAYADNGYYARNDDNGTGDQCKDLGNAFVRIFIT
jgi:hypothetical protein